MTNNALRKVYALCYEDEISGLVVEKGKCQGFEAWSFDALYDLSPEQSKRFIPSLLNDEYRKLFKELDALSQYC